MIDKISAIKRRMTSAFIADQVIIDAYKLLPGRTFDEQFSKASLESILFWTFATAVYALETLFDKHLREVEERVASLEPHTLRWYTRRAKDYLHGVRLEGDSDRYDTSRFTEAELAERRIIKYAVATESDTVVYLKVASADKAGSPQPLTDEERTAFEAYISEVKDAGVAVDIVSVAPDDLYLNLTVYYDPLVMSPDGTLHSNGRNLVEVTAREVVARLPFDGVYRTSDLMAALSALEGVSVIDIVSVETRSRHNGTRVKVDGYARPYAGYFAITELSIRYLPYNSYDNV